MAKHSVKFDVPIPFSNIPPIFGAAINHWVGNIQNGTSAFAKGLIDGQAGAHYQSGRTFAAALGPAMAKTQGVRHPTATSARVQIPASSTTYGGEMVVNAKAGAADKTTITIDGQTQGWFGSTVRENVESLASFLQSALPEIDQQNRTHSSAGASRDVAAELERLVALHKSGALSDQEFAQAKQKIIG
ncbi:SHOCT domain-containing protein [Hyphomicrobium sp.]|uniref:SHOCT domain-containing protein n=1 Tax=Hyphomicrobium sp. TaxID=82 RepID=UPI0025C2B029|nr:SHOCT domain-containing protein [Hyphomicrobium sp.]MCC7252433.1 SHOCT domain-containing protein [Hyphomicrobium sp.]